MNATMISMLLKFSYMIKCTSYVTDYQLLNISPVWPDNDIQTASEETIHIVTTRKS